MARRSKNPLGEFAEMDPRLIAMMMDSHDYWKHRAEAAEAEVARLGSLLGLSPQESQAPSARGDPDLKKLG